jgi:FkbM family methyltransferase
MQRQPIPCNLGRQMSAMLRRLHRLIRYNRDWPRYLWSRHTRPGRDDLSTFRLRNGQIVTLKTQVRFTLNEIYLDRVYDVPGVDLGRCHTVLDIGGNMGIFALYVASVAPTATVYCFEPHPQNFEMLDHNLKQNHVRAKAYRLAVSTSRGIGHLQVTGSPAEYSLGEASPSTTSVECVDLDHVFTLTGVDRFDFVKMDIEGHEREILAAWTDEQLRRVGALAVEWHHGMEELEALVRRLRELGFDAEPHVLDGHIRYLKARARIT